MLFSFIIEMFNFCINNVVGKTIINEGLFNILSSFRGIVREEDTSLALEISVFMIVLL